MSSTTAKHLPFVIYDTMTSTPFSGNATPVFILSPIVPWLPESSMQSIAREMNHSETVFVRLNHSSYDIRFYTPLAEEPLCGHGILGAAHALYAAGHGTHFDFTTVTGIKASASIVPPSSSSDHVAVSMAVPSSPVLPELALSEGVKTGFAKALDIDESTILNVGQNGLRDIILEVDPDLDFSAKTMTIDPVALLKASPAGTRSQVITSAWNLDPGVDFAKRVFAYGSEDPATGSTYCAMVPYWSEKLGKTELRCLQPSERGGGASLKWKDGGKEVKILAGCVKTVEGSIVVPCSGDEIRKRRAKL